MAEKELDIDELSVDELREELRKLNLKISGSKTVLRERLRVAKRKVQKPTEEGVAGKSRSGEEEENEDDSEKNCEDDGGTDNHSDSEEDSEKDEAAMSRRMKTRLTLSFRDVEDSLQTFSGDAKQNVRKWIEFEETCVVCGWEEAQQIIYAKKLLRGSAKLFVSYEKCATSWKKLKKSLISEFARTVNSKSVHKELTRTKKQNDESYHEYMYRMMEIASHADIELEAKIQYIIEGIPDDPQNKVVLYGAQNIGDLRKRLTQYEIMKGSQRNYQRSLSTRPGKEIQREATRVQNIKATDIRRCHNCGGKNHKAAECPFKDKGTKCFHCREFGHVAANCENRASVKQVNECNIPVKYDKKYIKP